MSDPVKTAKYVNEMSFERFEKITSKESHHFSGVEDVNLDLLKNMVDVWADVRTEIMDLPSGSIRKKHLMESLVKPGRRIQKGMRNTFWDKLLGGSNPSSEHHQRKKKLLEKSRRDEISLNEARELERLLKEQKRDREEEGNVLAAIGLGFKKRGNFLLY